MTQDRRARYRASIETTSKGVPSFSCTVEMEGSTQEEVLAELDTLTAELIARCHPDLEMVLGRPKEGME